MNVLRQSQFSLKATVLLLGILFISLGALSTLRFLDTMAPGVGMFALLTLLLAVGLYHMHAWARFICSALCWIALVLIIIGYVVSPFEDIDRAAMGLAPQSWLDRVLNVSPYVMVCLWIIRTFDTYKSLFSNPLSDRHKVDPQEVRQEGVR